MLDSEIRDLAQAKNFAALTVMLPSGTPMTHVMWVDADDDCILINTEIGRAKDSAMAATGRATVMVWDASNPYHYGEVRGRVVETITGEAAAAHIHKLANKYTGGDYGMSPTDTRIIYRIAPDRQRTM